MIVTAIATGIAAHVIAARRLTFTVGGLALAVSLALATTTTALAAHH